MPSITTEDVKKIAVLSRLNLNDADNAKFSEQLGSILSYIDTLSEVSTEGVEPFTAPQVNETLLRPDTLGATLPREEALQNAPQADECFFQVPAVVK